MLIICVCRLGEKPPTRGGPMFHIVAKIELSLSDLASKPLLTIKGVGRKPWVKTESLA